ncbi:hypothetical protein L593_06995 [Salinarchaeum sp. Harcht-Bsk1]|uniref:hypothetical protein n=1 Tax=Salinarchaeum sp. Harcht-Bsk1 TaxID=1333523 RepID=UPI00034241FD|nr:hypothetical protein [Salinarchaeum sp. Harcht-Bsk1]AGN01346.1 hypothetical protein L593_06995 [Salinarchaeum sp. Harcht-Bsk1]
MDAVVNETTKTVHRRADETASKETACGATSHVDPEHLSRTSLERARSAHEASKCGRCFEDGGSY